MCKQRRSLTETCLFAYASDQTRLDTRSITRKPIKVGIREGRVGYEPRLEPCLSMFLIDSQYEPGEPSLSKGVNNAAHSPAGSPAETGSLTASSLP